MQCWHRGLGELVAPRPGCGARDWGRLGAAFWILHVVRGATKKDSWPLGSQGLGAPRGPAPSAGRNEMGWTPGDVLGPVTPGGCLRSLLHPESLQSRSSPHLNGNATQILLLWEGGLQVSSPAPGAESRTVTGAHLVFLCGLNFEDERTQKIIALYPLNVRHC